MPAPIPNGHRSPVHAPAAATTPGGRLPVVTAGGDVLAVGHTGGSISIGAVCAEPA